MKSRRLFANLSSVIEAMLKKCDVIVIESVVLYLTYFYYYYNVLVTASSEKKLWLMKNVLTYLSSYLIYSLRLWLIKILFLFVFICKKIDEKFCFTSRVSIF